MSIHQKSPNPVKSVALKQKARNNHPTKSNGDRKGARSTQEMKQTLPEVENTKLPVSLKISRIREQDVSLKRETNILFFNLPESNVQASDERLEHDVNLIKMEISQLIGELDQVIVRPIIGLGKSSVGKPQVKRVSLRSAEEAKMFCHIVENFRDR